MFSRSVVRTWRTFAPANFAPGSIRKLASRSWTFATWATSRLPSAVMKAVYRSTIRQPPQTLQYRGACGRGRSRPLYFKGFVPRTRERRKNSWFAISRSLEIPNKAIVGGDRERSRGSGTAPQHSRCQRTWNSKGGGIRSVALGRTKSSRSFPAWEGNFPIISTTYPLQIIVTRDRSV